MGLLVDAVAGPCGHMFCRSCVERALAKDARCPLCRQDIAHDELTGQHLINMRVNSTIVCCQHRCGWFGRCDERRKHSKVCAARDTTEYAVKFCGALGCDLEETPNQQLLVTAIAEEGAAATYNRELGDCPARSIRPGCVVVGVNGVRGDCHALLHQFEKASRRDSPYFVVFKQPTEFCVTLSRNSRSVGLELNVKDKDSYLEIRSVLPEGAAMEHNRSNAGDQFKDRDLILEVNGVRGNCRELLRCLQASEILKVRICR